MARIFVIGSTDGLGRAAAETLIKLGHQVVVHARNSERSGSLSKLTGLGAEVVIGDLASEQETRALAEQGNGLGWMDAIIHNAGVRRSATISYARRLSTLVVRSASSCCRHARTHGPGPIGMFGYPGLLLPPKPFCLNRTL